MLRGLRSQLLLLSLTGAIGLVLLLGGGSYYLLKLYMQRSTDLALQAKMALQFRLYGVPLPVELVSAERDWLGNQNLLAVSTGQTSAPTQPASPTRSLKSTPTETATILPPTPTLTYTTSPPPSTPTGQPRKTPVKSAAQQVLKEQAILPAVGAQTNSGDDGDDGDDNEDEQFSAAPSKSRPTPIAVIPNLIVPMPTDTSLPATADDQLSDEQDDGSSSLSLASQAPQPSSNSPGAVFINQEDSADDRLNSVFVIPLDTKGQVIQNSSLPAVTTILDRQASAAALATGYDLRTIQLGDGSRARLLTYRTAISGGPELLQVGRLLNEQDQVLRWFLTGVLALATVSVLLLGLGGWWLSGRALNPAQRAWENQQTFIANASHELRAPLTLVKANAEVGLRLAPPPEQKEVLTEILNESDYMNRLVEDLLLLSRLDTHRLKLERAVIEVKDLLAEVRRQMSLIAASKGISINLGETEGKIWGDPVRIRQVILILIDNSLRFTPAGGQIKLETHPAGRTVQIVVSDNGAGIPVEDLSHVFDRFYQAGRSGEEEPRGNGLGLSIAKALIEAQGGNIRIASTEGLGTQVSLQLPSGDYS